MKNLIVLSFLLAVVLGSCKKDSNVPTPLPITANEILKQVITLDASQSAPNDTLAITDFSYDNLNRCIQITYRQKQYPFTGYIYNYYNGSDTVIVSRKIYNVDLNSSNNQDSIREFFTYASDGQMLSDSIIEYGTGIPNHSNYKYQVSNNLVLTTITDDGQPFMQGRHHLQKDNNGNLVSEIDSGFIYVAGSGYALQATGNINITYDNYNSPVYKLYPKRVIEMDFENVPASSESPLAQKNNITSANYSSTQSGTTNQSSFSSSYIYNSSGFPSAMIVTDNLNALTNKVIYIYQ